MENEAVAGDASQLKSVLLSLIETLVFYYVVVTVDGG